MKGKCTAILLILAWTSAQAQTGPAWAWNSGKITNNGSVSVKSTNGTSTYNAVQNPTGAVAKTNQSAVTQPPTVIIQATSGGGYQEMIPLISYANGGIPPAVPTCPGGYTSLWTGTLAQYTTASMIFNIAGTRFHWGSFATSGGAQMGWMWDGQLFGVNGGPASLSYPYNYYSVAGNLCAK